MSLSVRRLTAAAVTLLAALAGTAVLASPAHAAGLSGKERVTSATAKSTAPHKTHQVYCPTGKVAVSGGAYVDGPGTVRLDLLRPAGAYFEAGATSTTGRPSWALHAYAICAYRRTG